jgi:hypothetical protein
VQIGDCSPLLKGVAYTGPQHDHGTVSGAQQSAQVELLQGGLAVRPGDRLVPRRQRGSRPTDFGARPGVQVLEDAAALPGDGRQCRRQLNGGEGLSPWACRCSVKLRLNVR